MCCVSDRSRFTKKFMTLCVAVMLACQGLLPAQAVAAKDAGSVFGLPQVGAMVRRTSAYAPTLIRGIQFYPDNPLKFNFLIDTGDAQLTGQSLEEEANKLVRYFMAALTVPEESMWVNLSPYESDRIIPDTLAETEMGRDLLAQDYLLKQLTASLMHPEDELGRTFWNRVHQKAQARFGTMDIPLDTFNKVWIVPDQARVYEDETGAYVVSRHLKVMLEQDYVAQQHSRNLEHGTQNIETVSLRGANERSDAAILNNGRDKAYSVHRTANKVSLRGVQRRSNLNDLNPKPLTLDPKKDLAQDLIRELLIPEIEREVNEGQTFAPLRQIYDAMILATWYKINLKESLLGQVYVDRNRISGIDTAEKDMKQAIYQQYLAAFKDGVFNFIKEDLDPATHQVIPRKYFSGGITVSSPAVDFSELVDRGTLEAKAPLMSSALDGTVRAGLQASSPASQLFGAEVELDGWGQGSLPENQGTGFSSPAGTAEQKFSPYQKLTDLNGMLKDFLEYSRKGTNGEGKGYFQAADEFLFERLYEVTYDNAFADVDLDAMLTDLRAHPPGMFDMAGKKNRKVVLETVKLVQETIAEGKKKGYDKMNNGYDFTQKFKSFLAYLEKFHLSSPVPAQSSPGGIDLDADLLDLEVSQDGAGVSVPVPQQPVSDMPVEGFVPVMIQLTPLPALPPLLNLVVENEPEPAEPTSSDKLSRLK